MNLLTNDLTNYFFRC